MEIPKMDMKMGMNRPDNNEPGKNLNVYNFDQNFINVHFRLTLKKVT